MDHSDDQKLRELLDFAEECRLALKYAVSIANEFHLRETARDPVHVWGIGLGALAFDISGAIIELVRGRFYWAVEMQLRSMFEYLVRLHYVSNNPDWANAALANADKVLCTAFKAKDSVVNTLADEFTEEERKALEPWLNQTDRPDFGSIKKLFEDFDKNHGQHIYEHIYAMGSSYIHGKDLIFYDVIHPFEIDPNDRIDWQSQRFSELQQANWLIYFVLQILGYVEKISDRGRRYPILFKQHEALLKNLNTGGL